LLLVASVHSLTLALKISSIGEGCTNKRNMSSNGQSVDEQATKAMARGAIRPSVLNDTTLAEQSSALENTAKIPTNALEHAVSKNKQQQPTIHWGKLTLAAIGCGITLAVARIQLDRFRVSLPPRVGGSF
jgi:hypothetical protein